MIKSLLLVGVGSFLGGASRFYISTLMKNIAGQGFPWGTLMVNLLGCFLFGVVFALFHKHSMPSNMWCLLLTTGFCGGFTTFSAFAHEGVLMLQSGNITAFIIYLLLSIVTGLALVAVGYKVALLF